MPITNKDRFPGADWLPDDKIKTIGDVGGTPLVALGKDPDGPLVARSNSADPTTESLFAVPLYELLNHSQDPINIPEQVDFAESDGLLPDSEYDTIADDAGDPAVIQEALDGWKQSAPGEFRNLPDADGSDV